MSCLNCIGVDLGASGGKMAKASFDGKRLFVSEFHTFKNRPVETPAALYWDVFGLYHSILDGVSKFAQEGEKIESIAIDTWGASYGLLDKKNRLLEPMYHYRDSRTANSINKIFSQIDRKEVFKMTGCQCNRTYTLPQLYSYIEEDSEILNFASKMLFMPDLLEYFLTGEISTELSIAGTSGLLNSSLDGWCYELFERLSIPTHILTNFINAGEIKGTLLKSVQKTTGLGNAKIVATLGHDTACAVAAIPDFGEGSVYISMGTNTNIGIESQESVLTEDAFDSGFKNTGGISGSKIIYRDFAGFWLINELMRIWSTEGRVYSFSDIVELAERTTPRKIFIDVEEQDFNDPGGDIRVKINNHLSKINQKPIKMNDDGEFVRCILESIALKIKHYVNKIETDLKINVKEVYVVNGGSRNWLLMQMISDALGMNIKAGMPYATIIGNVLTQLYSLGEIKTVAEMRELSKLSFDMKTYTPENEDYWRVQCNEDKGT